MAGPHFTWLELLIRLGSALLLGALIGAERQWRQRTAGLRTYSLVSIGAALFVLLAALTGIREEGERILCGCLSGNNFCPDHQYFSAPSGRLGRPALKK